MSVDLELPCQEWPYLRSGAGYGQCGEKPYSLVHRVVYEMEFGRIPEKHDVHHRCENPPCFEPTHLIALTHAEHMALHRKISEEMIDMMVDLRVHNFSHHWIAEMIGGVSHQGVRDCLARRGLTERLERDRRVLIAYEPIPATYWAAGRCMCGTPLARKTYQGRNKQWCSEECGTRYRWAKNPRSLVDLEYVGKEGWVVTR